ncbi:MAG: O-antigen ligase family protein [Thermodesulfobacteriota bacterium]|nr:O-antigen ligase family protein [Thermodesulfobacteriota bacterium]
MNVYDSPINNQQSTINNPYDIIIECGIIFLIVFTPLAFGTVHVWAYTVMELIVLFLLLVWLLKLIYLNRSFPHFRISFVKTPLNLPLCLFFLLVLFQMVPLSPSIIEHISPNTYDLYIQTVPGYGVQEADLNNTSDKISANRPLSIYSHATRDELLKVLAYVTVFLLIINNIKTRDQMRRLVLAIIITGTVVAFLGIMQMLSGTNKIYWFWLSKYKIGNYFGPFVNPNHFAGYMGMVIPLGIGLLIARLFNRSFIPAGSWRHRLSVIESHLSKNSLLIFIIVIMGLSLIFSLSRGGILCFLFSMIFFFTILGIKRSQRKKRKIGAVILGLIFAMLIWIGIDPVLKELSTLSDIRFTSYSRTIISKDTLNIARDFPFFGVGLGNFQHIYSKYTTLKTRGYTHAHNDYMEMLADTGWSGAILFFGGIVFLLLKTLLLWHRRRDPFVTGITLGAVTGAVFILLQNMVTFNFHIPANAMLFFIILGLTVVVVHPSIPVRNISFHPRMKSAVYFMMFILLAGFAVTVVNAYQGEKYFKLYKRSTGPMIPQDLIKSIDCDLSNAAFHYELGRYYAKAMSKCWKDGNWKYVKGKWIFEPGKNTSSNGMMALDSFFQAVILQPTNAWYHFNLGWMVEQLGRFFPETTAGPISPYPSIRPIDEFNLAIILAPGNSYIKKHAEKSKAESSANVTVHTP